MNACTVENAPLTLGCKRDRDLSFSPRGYRKFPPRRRIRTSNTDPQPDQMARPRRSVWAKKHIKGLDTSRDCRGGGRVEEVVARMEGLEVRRLGKERDAVPLMAYTGAPAVCLGRFRAAFL